MSSGELRLILLVIGLIVLALIYFFGTRQKKDNTVEDFDPIEPLLDQDVPSPVFKAPAAEPEIKPEDTNVQPDSSKIVTLFLHAKDGQQFDWHMIKTAADKAGLEYGDDNIFYRYREIGHKKDMLFLVANMLKPGFFNPDIRTSGLVLILRLPGVMSALDMWDIMFPVGERMTELLGGKLTDENHNLFSNQRIASMREEMREFDRKNLIT